MFARHHHHRLQHELDQRGTATSARSAAAEYQTYYRHVRATNSFGTVYSGAPNAYRSFTTGGFRHLQQVPPSNGG
jgi:hypothetical protein